MCSTARRHPGYMMQPLRGWGDCRVVAGLLAVAVGDSRVDVAVGGQGVGAGLVQVHDVGGKGQDEVGRGGVAVIGEVLTRLRDGLRDVCSRLFRFDVQWIYLPELGVNCVSLLSRG
jgi:hypothetical protein